tara:strand:+ start:606 stop:1097 length:492 start_codon:yes stop_codon:yes gene_type:complete
MAVILSLLSACTINIGTASDVAASSSSNSDLSYIEAPLDAVSALQASGLYCDPLGPEWFISEAWPPDVEVHVYQIWCHNGQSGPGSYYVWIYDSKEDFRQKVAADCEGVHPSRRDFKDPEMITWAWGENWESFFLGKESQFTIRDVAKALGGESGKNRLNFCG